jgi:hypothetical protein
MFERRHRLCRIRRLTALKAPANKALSQDSSALRYLWAFSCVYLVKFVGPVLVLVWQVGLHF